MHDDALLPKQSSTLASAAGLDSMWSSAICAALVASLGQSCRLSCSVVEVSKLCTEKGIFHIINNAYGVQVRFCLQSCPELAVTLRWTSVPGGRCVFCGLCLPWRS